MTSTKEEILQNLLNKAFNSRILNLEKRAKEDIKSLAFTKKSFDSFEKTIVSLIKNVKATKERRLKEKERQKIKMSSSLRSKTTTNIHNQYTSTMPNPSSSKYQINIKSNRHPLSKSLTDKQLGTTLNMIKKKTGITKKKFLICSNNSFTSSSRKSKIKLKNSNLAFNTSPNYFSSSAQKPNINNDNNISLMKKPLEFRKELLSIQMQIKNVEHNILTTEKAIEHKKTLNSLEQSQISFRSLKKVIISYDDYLTNKSVIKQIISFLSDYDSLKFLSTSKKLFKQYHVTYLDSIISKIESGNQTKIDIEIQNLKEKYGEEEITKPYQDFILTRGSIKAIEFLDQDLYNKIFTKEELDPSLQEIIIIYRILYQFLKKEDFVNIKDDDEFWKENCKYLLTEGKDKLGSFFIEKSKDFCFDPENCAKLKAMIEKIKSKIIPSYYSKICGTTGLVVFILKDALEYCGVIVNDKKTQPRRIYDNLLYEKKMFIQKIKKIRENVYLM